ncbi:MAG: tetratricopeptide repeat protein [Luteolibacter sp.]
MIVSRSLLLAVAPLYVLSASAQVPPPEKALKYHEVLLKRPQNAAMFDRFYGAWIDEQPVEAMEAFLKARTATHGGQDWTILARYQMRRGQEDQALESLAKAIEAVPGDPTLPMERAKIRLRRMEFASAREDLAKAATGKDETIALEASKMIGRSWMREGRSEQAVATWDALLARHPGDEDLLEDLVESAASDGETEQALTYLSKLIESGSDPYRKTLRAIRRGDLLVQAGKTDEAIAAYSATLAEVGEGSWLEQQVLAQIDKTFRKQDRLADLTTELKKLAESHPRRFFIHRQLAKLEAAQGDVDPAIGRFREILQRSPGNRELREEFIRLLSDAERFDDAAAELEKMIGESPADAELQLQLAALRHRKEQPEAVMTALKKAHELLGSDEANGIRIASLMLQYSQAEAGEALLRQLSASPGASPAPAEALATEYSRTRRKNEALELLKKIGTTDDAETILRVAASISVLGENQAAYDMLAARAEKFPLEPRYLAALAQAAMATGKPEEGISPAMKLVRLAKQSAELRESLNLASRIIVAADKVPDWIATLQDQSTRTSSETCLLATLLEQQSDTDSVEKLLSGNPDPLMIHFYATLLDQRGEFDQAITEFSRLAETDEGRKAEYFKNLSELQQRAGKPEEAIATVERWKQSAPGDKTAWIIASRLLRDSGKLPEAIRMTRQATARFEGDTDLAASLAALHEEAGETTEAEAIYWRLYDAAKTPADQARWAAPLAQLAVNSGKTAELDEQLQERARGNRRSIGPILAQVELARLTRDEAKRRSLLFEALRLQPDNIDLRLQIANLEEQNADLDGAVALLEEAVAKDTSGKLRAALAQAYLRQGKVLKGMRELQALSGKQADDPRAIEASAASLAASGMYEEAITFLRDMLPEGGDWRNRYLLAVMLEQDGREEEAIPIFLSLLQASGELTSLPPKSPLQQRYFDGWDPAALRIYQLHIGSNFAYLHKNPAQRHYYGPIDGLSMAGPFALPDRVDVLKDMALIHLLELGGKSESGAALLERIRSTGIGDLDFLNGFLTIPRNDPSAMIQLLEKFPGQPGLLEAVMMLGFQPQGESTFTPELVRKIFTERKNLSASLRFNAWLRVMGNPKADPKPWDEFFAAADACFASKEKNAASTPTFGMLQLLSQGKERIPEPQRDRIRALIQKQIAAVPSTGDEFFNLRLSAMVVLEDTDGWIGALNAYLPEARKNSKSPRYPMSRSNPAKIFQFLRYGSSGGYNPWANSNENVFELPHLNMLSLRSIPMNVLARVKPKPGQYPSIQHQYALDPALLKGSFDRIESPVMRTWLALNIDDEAAADKALAATPPAEEAADFALLKGYRAVTRKQYAEAYRLFDQTRSGRAADADYQTWLNFTLVGIASEMTPEERAEIRDSLSSALVQCRRIAGIPGASVVAAKAEQLGLTDLSKRLAPPQTLTATGGGGTGPASFAPPSGTSGGSSSGSLDRYNKCLEAKKYDAAAREAMLLIRAAKANQQSRYQISNLNTNIPAEVAAELLKLAEPGDSRSLTKRLEYVDICIFLNKPDLAVATLEALEKERPNDATIAARLLFALPPAKRERALELLSRCAASDDWIGLIDQKFDSRQEEADTSAIIDLFAIVAQWLETTPPADLEKSNLTWVPYYGKRFFDHMNGVSSLISDSGGRANANELSKRRAEVAKHLALSMLRHPATSEEGFRLLFTSNSWKLPDEEMDAHARTAISHGKLTPSERGGFMGDFFMLVRGGSLSSYGDSMDANSSVRWLVRRLSLAQSPEKILPPGFLEEMRKKSAVHGEMLTLMTEISTLAQLETFWKSPAMKNESPLGRMLKSGVLYKAARIRGSNAFFIDTLKGVTLDSYYGRDSGPQLALMTATLTAGLHGTATELDAATNAVSRCILGEGKNWSELSGQQEDYQRIYWLQHLCNQLILEPGETLRLYRSLYRMKVPVGSGTHYAIQSLANKSLKTTEDVVRYLNSLGWLDEVATWEPCEVYSMESEGSGIYRMKKNLLTEDLHSNLNLPGSRQDVVKALKERKPSTFGALITAAAFSSGEERTELATRAFIAAAPKIDKLPAARLENFESVMQWVRPDALAKMPKALRAKFEAANAERAKEWEKSADDFLSNPNTGRNYNSVFYVAKPIIEKLVPTNPEKATAVFLEAERRSTIGSGTGGRSYGYSVDGIQILYRDSMLFNFMDDDDSPFRTSPEKALRFLKNVLNDPAGTRFTFTTQSKGSPVLADVGIELLRPPANTSQDDDGKWPQAVEKARKLPEDLRTDAFIAIACADFSQLSSIKADRLEKQRQQARESVGKYPDFLPYREISLGLAGWKVDQPEGKLATSKTLATVLGTPSIAEPSRMQLALAALSRAPGILEQPEVAETLTALYETYCAGERTAVNPLSLAVIQSITGKEIASPALPYAKRIHTAFWKNANASKAGGHSQIAPSAALTLYGAALRVGDDSQTQKLFAQLKQGYAGQVPTIAQLIAFRKFDEAKALLSAPNEIYQNIGTFPTYTRELEESLAEFGKSGVDPLQFTRIECQLLKAKRTDDDDRTPRESLYERKLRLANTYLKNPPSERMVQLEMLVVISESTPPAAEVLRAPLKEIAATVDFPKAIGTFVSATGRDQKQNPPSAIAELEMHVTRFSALTELLHGDPGPCDKFIEVLTESDAKNSYNSSFYSIGRLYRNLTDDSALWLVSAIGGGQMDGFLKARPAYEKLAVAKNSTIRRPELSLCLRICRFLATWDGHPEDFAAVLEKVKNKEATKNINSPDGLKWLVDSAGARGIWKEKGFEATRRAFLSSIFSNPRLAVFFPASDRWASDYGKKDLTEDLLALDTPLPETFIPPVHAPLLLFKAKRQKSGDKMETFRMAVDACPSTPEWNEFKNYSKWEWANALFSSQQADRARTIFASIPKEEVTESLKKRYDELGKKLAKKP